MRNRIVPVAAAAGVLLWLASLAPGAGAAKGQTQTVVRLGAREVPWVQSPPLLVWQRVPGATYYNVQIFRNGRKVLSSWPRRNRLALRSKWSFGGTRQQLVPGRYRWYVWPGSGPRTRARYGRLLGANAFVVWSGS